ncbi:hypothetical protein QQS21_000928 [Conoideocrella luteorostrata]|uniref:GH16 domain-containing protein n=1 Tax=Conoideocrella luteorostrata TaxID=1105319 RepID=A0AAJ0CXX2_9HYPO|nr:hypothetical protein QQS21_000928 [Conoideocrella luteorostrata]
MRNLSALRQLSLALSILCTQVTAEIFHIRQTYDAKNFFDEFSFETTGTVTNQSDDNWSWVHYQNKDNATKKGLAAIKNGEVYLGVDHTTSLNASSAGGRDSLRIASRETFKYGLLIARFTHLPKLVCGGWPAYWTLGQGEWPVAGEIDIYEGWNLNTKNRPALHIGPAALVGNCTIEPTDQNSKVISKVCDNKFADNKTQFLNQGCQSEEENNGIWASESGGIQALEWTREYLKIFTWLNDKAPSGLDKDEIDTSSWGKPSVHIQKSRCDIDRAFKDQRILFTLPMCGNPPGNEEFWHKIDGGSGKTCDKVTNSSTCEDYVAKNPEAFKDFYFQIKDLRLFKSNNTSAFSDSSHCTSANSTMQTTATSNTSVSNSGTTTTFVTQYKTSTGQQPSVPSPSSIVQVSSSESSRNATQNGSTSTIFSTILNTIRRCPPYKRSCALSELETETSSEIVALSTTVIPISTSSPSTVVGPNAVTTLTIQIPTQTVSVTITKTVVATESAKAKEEAAKEATITVTKTVNFTQTVNAARSLSQCSVPTVTVLTCPLRS